MKSFFTLLLFSNLIFAASPQLPDLLLIGKDTIYIYHLPINELKKSVQKQFIDNISTINNEIGVSLNLWRRYRGVWELNDDKLFLIDIKNVDNAQEIMKKTFPKKYKDGKVFANWFSSYLTIPKDEMLKWDGIFSRTYRKEEKLTFKKGKLINWELIQNYVDLENGISRLKKDIVTKKIFESINKLDWTVLSDCECDDEYYVTIGKNGIVDKVKFVPYLDTKWQNFWYSFSHRKCTRLIRKKLTELQFDIVKWNGKPYKDQYRIELFYDQKTKTLENWTK
ncbi:hypothetical protein [Aquimarina macrocephali]|uniref:hypothetical protein n=1 Tax=Aquimarina macrocephali TaxID=666563 RepID=UPI00046516D6|nr:hypothetical protein [Aquimarina macrocephali]